MVNKINYLYITIFCIFFQSKTNAQNVNLDNISLQEVQRVNSLLDTTFLNKSFTIRNSTFLQNFEFVNWKKVLINNFSFGYVHQDNSNLPYGYNDGSFSNSSGVEFSYNPQLNFQWGRITLQFAPEKVISENKFFEGLPTNFEGYQSGDAYWRRYYEISENIIENPINKSNINTDKVYPGQSNLLYNSKNISFGISTENLWWGPGINHSLILTNNASGFSHVTVRTNKPIKTNFGSIDFQIIGGNLINLKKEPTYNENPFASRYYISKPTNDRYLTGMIFTFQPKFTKNLFIGISNMAYMYKKNMNGLEDITPFSNFSKFTRLKQRPTLGSVFLRYAIPKDHAELYFEYGRNDRAATPLNLFEDSIPTGYVAGIRKLFPLSSNINSSAISLNIEVVHLSMMNPNQIFKSNLLAKRTSWYTSDLIPQGYTNDGQVIGSFVGPGSNAQNLNIEWVKGIKKLGFGIERIVYNKDFYYYNYFKGLEFPGPNFKYWADFNFNISFRWNIGDLIFSANYKSIDSYNYMWTKLGNGGLYGPSDTDKKNVQIILSVKYLISRKF